MEIQLYAALLLKFFNQALEERLRELSRANRALVETQYTWERFCGTVWKTVERYLEDVAVASP